LAAVHFRSGNSGGRKNVRLRGVQIKLQPFFTTNQDTQKAMVFYVTLRNRHKVAASQRHSLKAEQQAHETT